MDVKRFIFSLVIIFLRRRRRPHALGMRGKIATELRGNDR